MAAATRACGSTSTAVVEQTLRAALADPQAAAVLAAGILVKPLVASGFGPVDLGGAVLVAPSDAPPRPVAAVAPPAQPARTAERDDAAASRASLERAEQALAREQDGLSEAQATEAEAVEDVQHLQESLEAAKRGAAEAALARRQAEKAVERATAARDRAARRRR